MGYLEFHQLSTEDKISIFNQVEYDTSIPTFALEKDWWVVRVLDIIFQTDIANHTVFKGGTSLSKAWGLIHRFSEDVDLALDRSFLGFDNPQPKRKEITKLRKTSKAYILEELIPQIRVRFENSGLDGVSIRAQSTTESDKDPLILEINYPNITDYTDYVLPRVLVEIGIRSLREPFTKKTAQSVVADWYSDRPFADAPISIPTVNVERTFLEKLFLLHEEFQRPVEKRRVNRLSRHLYDIHQIAQTEYAINAITDMALYTSIIKHREVFIKVGGVDYQTHYPPNLNPIPPESIIEAWKADYTVMLEQMIYGVPVSFDELIKTITNLKDKINGQKFHY